MSEIIWGLAAVETAGRKLKKTHCGLHYRLRVRVRVKVTDVNRCLFAKRC